MRLSLRIRGRRTRPRRNMKSMNLTRTMRTRATPGLHAVAGRLGPRLTATAFSPASCLLPFPDLPAASMHRRVSRTRYRAVTLTQEAVGGEVAARLGDRVRARSAQVVLRRVGDECSFCLPRVVFGKAPHWASILSVVVFAALWPFANKSFEGRTLVVLSPTHGITSHDLLSVLAVIVVAVRMVRWIVAKKS